MSRFVAKSNSVNNTSASGLSRSFSMTPEQFRSRVQSPPGAPEKPKGWERMTPNQQRMFPEYIRSIEGSLSPSGPGATVSTPDTNTNMSSNTLRRTYSALPGQVDGFMPPPNGSIQGLLRTSDSTERSVATTAFNRSRSPTLANINEALPPRTDAAVNVVLNATDSDGNVNVNALNEGTVNEGLKQAAKREALDALNLFVRRASVCESFNTLETRMCYQALDAARDALEQRNGEWDSCSFDFGEQVTLDNEKSITEIGALLGDAALGVDVADICAQPEFTVSRVVVVSTTSVNTSGRVYHLTWNASPTVKLIVRAETAFVLFNRRANEAAVEEPQNKCIECGVDMGPDNPRQLCGKTRCAGYGYDTQEEEEQIENPEDVSQPLNRSFSPDNVPELIVGSIYQRKEREGEPIPWVETNVTMVHPPYREYMQPGHRVVILANAHPDPRIVTFKSLNGGILTSDVYLTDKYGNTFTYVADKFDFLKHMELVAKESSVEKPTASVKSGGTLGGRKGVNKLTGVNSNKRKAVDNSEDMQKEPSTPPKKRGRGRPKGSTKKKKSDVPFAGVVSSQTEYFKMHDERQQQEAILTSIQRANGVKRRAVTTKRQFTTKDGTNTRHAVVGEINENGILSPTNSPSNLCRSLSWDNEPVKKSVCVCIDPTKDCACVSPNTYWKTPLK